MNQSELQAQIEFCLDSLLKEQNLVPELYESCAYSVLNGGKRLRPRIAASVLKDLAEFNLTYLSVFCALELLHCSSLIHDDLPCMDNDDFRRGKPTSHKVYGEAQALLSGDALVAIASNVITDSKILNNEKKVLLLSIISNTYIQLCNGQLWDLNTEKRKTSLIEIHRRKTGALFSASFVFGGVCVSEDPLLHDHLNKLGIKCGIFFQMLDDYLDIVGDQATRGRPAGSDKKNNRITDFSEDQFDINKLQFAKSEVFDQIETIETFTQKKLSAVRHIIEELVCKI